MDTPDTVHHLGRRLRLRKADDAALRDVVCDQRDAMARLEELLGSIQDALKWGRRGDALPVDWDETLAGTPPQAPPATPAAREARWRACNVHIPGRRTINHTVADLSRDELEAVWQHQGQALGRVQSGVMAMLHAQTLFEDGVRIQPEHSKPATVPSLLPSSESRPSAALRPR